MSSESDQVFMDWLNSDAWPLLLKCAGSLLKKGDAPRDIDSVEEYASAMWLMLREREGAFKARAARCIAAGDWVALRRYVMSMTRSFRAERNRDKYYQRVRQVLAKAGSEVGYRVEGDHATYGSSAEGAVRIPSFAALKGDGLRVTFPGMSEAELRSGDGIFKLAATFRQQLEGDGRYGRKLRIPVRELCDAVRDLWKVEYDMEMEDLSGSIEDGRSWDERVSAMQQDAAPEFWTEDSLREAADRVALQLDDRQQLFVFCLSVYCRFKQAEIATMIGLGGASAVNYRLVQARETLQFLLSLEEELDTARQELFMKMVLDNCNEEDCSRLKEKKDMEETRS